jgi:hypothetical protein
MPDFAALRAPFAPERISWRVGSTNGDKTKGMALAYLDARDVQDRLDDVLGPDGWANRYPHVGAKTVCEIGIRMDDSSWVWKSDGAGDSDIEAEKGALSDAFKRAAVKWGIGRYLYDLDSPWVKIEPAGRSYRIMDAEMAKLRSLLTNGPKPTLREAIHGNALDPRQETRPAPKPIPENEDVLAARRAYKAIMDAVRRATSRREANGIREHFMEELDAVKKNSEAGYKALDAAIAGAEAELPDLD